MPQVAPALPRLTERQRDIFLFIFDRFSQSRTYPSQSEIKRHFKTKSNNTGAMVKPLLRKGLLHTPSGGGRGEYAFTSLGVEYLEHQNRRLPPELLIDDNQPELTESC